MWILNFACIFVVLSHSGCIVSFRKIVVLMDSSNSSYKDVILSRDWSKLLSTVHLIDSTHIEVKELDDRNTAEHVTKLCDDNNQSSVAIVDTTHGCLFADIASNIFYPYIRVSYRHCQGRNIFNIRPPLAFYAEAAINYTTKDKTMVAKSVLIYDEVFGQEAVSEVLYSIQPHILTRMMTSSDHGFSSWLNHLTTRKTLHFIVAVGTKTNIDILFEKACSVKIPDTFHWTVVLTDHLYYNWTVCPINHLVVLRHRLSWNNMQRPPTNNSITSAFLIDALTLAVGILNKQKVENKLKVSCKEENIDISEDATLDIKMERAVLNSVFKNGITGLLSEDRPIKMELELLRIDYPDPRPAKLGTWTESTGFLLFNESSQTDTKYKISVVTKHEPPFVLREETENGTRFTGYSVDVFDEIARRLNLEYTMYEPSDGQYGKQNPDGTWTGLMGEILTGYADIAVASLSMTTERDRVADFTTPYYEFGGIQILIKSNNPGTSILAFATVFTSEVWACWAIVLILSGCLVFVFERFSPYSPYNNDDLKSLKKYTLNESMWLVIASFTMSGPECTPLTFSTRMMIGGFWFFCSIMMATYTANLAAFLTTSRLNVPIESLDDLAKQNSIKYSVVQGTVIQEYFERMANIESNLYEQWKNMSFYAKEVDSTANLPTNYAVWDYPLGDKYMTIWKSIQKTGLINDSSEGLAKVLEGNFAFIHESPMVQYELSKHCDLIAVGKQFSSRPYAFALPQGSPLTSSISYTILELQSETILESLKTKWWKNGSTTCSRVDESGGLSFHTVGGIFLLVIGGIVLGVISLIAESIWSSLTGVPKESHNTNVTSPNSRTNLASDFNSGFLANGIIHENDNFDPLTLEMATLY